MITVAIIDDSATMRAIIRESLSNEPDLQVIGEAEDAFSARSLIKEKNPDIVTLDINMPHMSGLEFLNRLMTLHPMPAVILSSEGETAKTEARRFGCPDFVSKPKPGEPVFKDLADTLRRAVRNFQQSVSNSVPPKLSEFIPNDRIIAIGASTGGVEALAKVLEAFPENCPPTVITQHMPAGFTKNFSTRLNRVCKPKISEARSGILLKPGHIYIAPGSNTHLQILGRERPMCKLAEGPLISGHRPSVDSLFTSMARYGPRTIGVILTGMGRDGAEGLLQIKQAGGLTIGQDERSSLVYGMPRAAARIGAVSHVLPLDKIADFVLENCRAGDR